MCFTVIYEKTKNVFIKIFYVAYKDPEAILLKKFRLKKGLISFDFLDGALFQFR